ncbi:recombinase family protein [Sinorhizobium chiapasense]
MVSRTILYIRAIATSTAGGREFQQAEQIRACTQAAISAGCPVRRDSDGEPKLLSAAVMQEPLSGSDKILKDILRDLQPVDTVVISTLQVLGETPSQLVANLAKLIASGCRLIVADMGHVDFPLIRQIALGFSHLEERCQRLQGEIDSYYLARAEERREYQREIRHQVLDTLIRQGIDVVDMLPKPEGRQLAKETDPVHGKHLKEMRLGLELSQDEAGKLLALIGENIMPKAEISGYETKGIGLRIEEYETALRAEIARRKLAARQDKAIAKASNGSAGPPLTAVEAKLFPEVNHG